MLRRLSLRVTIFSLALSCGPALHSKPPAEFASVGQPIIGGVFDPNDPAVVALFAHLPGESRGSLCTAEVIAPNVLLTAAHCVHPDVIGPDRIFEGLLGPVISGAERVAVSEVHYDPLFNPGVVTQGHDVGVAILTKPVDIKPLPYNRLTMTGDMVNSPVRLIGYGLSDRFDQSTAGTKREVTTRLRAVQPLLIQVGTFSQQNCSGDSGGPALMDIDGVETIVGVTSFGFILCLGDGGYDTRVDAVSDFIDAYVQ